MWRVTPNLMAMLGLLPRESTKVFGEETFAATKQHTLKRRKESLSGLQNPRC